MLSLCQVCFSFEMYCSLSPGSESDYSLFHGSVVSSSALDRSWFVIYRYTMNKRDWSFDHKQRFDMYKERGVFGQAIVCRITAILSHLEA